MSRDREDGFLARWSRLKRETEQPAKQPLPAETKSPAQQEEAAPDADAPFDPAKLEIPLPSLDDLKPGDSLVAFMQRGVPDVLRNAALRKMWVLDPMVRDFRSEALDYAYDWNTPGGLPGITGPLAPNDNIESMVEAIFRPMGEGQEEPKDEPSAEKAPEDQPMGTPEPAAIPVESANDLIAENEPKAELQAEKPVETVEMPRKRHGGAMPQV